MSEERKKKDKYTTDDLEQEIVERFKERGGYDRLMQKEIKD